MVQHVRFQRLTCVYDFLALNALVLHLNSCSQQVPQVPVQPLWQPVQVWLQQAFLQPLLQRLMQVLSLSYQAA